MIEASKNYYVGEQITDAKTLIELSLNCECVYHHNWKVTPAAFIVGMPFRVIMRILESKTFYKIIKKTDYNGKEKSSCKTTTTKKHY